MLYQNSSLRDYSGGWNGADTGRSRNRGLKWAVIGVASGIGLGLLGINSYEANAIKFNKLGAANPQMEFESAPLAVPRQTSIEEVLEPQVSTNATVTPLAMPHESPAVAPRQASQTADTITQQGKWKSVEVKTGDSLAKIFQQAGLPARQLHDILALGEDAKKLKRIHPGEILRLQTDKDTGLIKLVYEIDSLNALEINRSGDDYTARLIAREPERRTVAASGTIDNSLFLAAGKAGLPDKVTMELAGIFGWDIDFALDIRQGDQFAVLYEELYLDGKHIGTGNILAAEFVNNHREFQAVRYTDDQQHTDYYAADGRSMRKAFLRTPVSFSRISSRFSLGRKHPILNRIRAHKGVDYAAPRGTPVKATGAGKIVHRGKKGGYGNTVVIQHGSSYSTLYAHLSRYANGLKSGSRVHQGQVIGYVGSSGLATGPHLHYEFRVNGAHRNPLTVQLPSAQPLAKKYRDDFARTRESLLSQLELNGSQTVALQDE